MEQLSSTRESILEGETEFQDFKEMSPSDMTTKIYNWTATFDRYYTPALCVFGILGNILSIIIFFTKSHKARGSLSSSVYLSALALSDTGFLINLLIIWLDNIDIKLTTNSIICPTIFYVGQVTSFLSVYFVVVFTIERTFVVCYPLFRPSKFTATRAKKITAGLTIFSLIAFSYVFAISGVEVFLVRDPQEWGKNSTFISHEMTKPSHESLLELSTATESGIWDNNISFLSFPQNILPIDKRQDMAIDLNLEMIDNTKEETVGNRDELRYVKICTVPEKYYGVNRIITYIDSVVTFLIPFLLISVLNMKIIFCVKKIRRHRESMIANTKLKISNQHRLRSSASIHEKNNLGDCFTTLYHFKRRNRGRMQRRSMSQSEAILHCTKHNCGNRKEGPSQGACVAAGRRPSIASDSQISPGQVTPPFKQNLTTPTPSSTEIRVTKTLLLVSTVFLILHFPSHFIRAITFFESLKENNSPERLRQLNVAQHFANILFNTNFAINFLLYCCCGKAFRHSIKNLLPKDQLFRKNTRSPASTVVLTTQLTLHTDSVSTTCKYNTRRVLNKYQQESKIEEDQL